MEISKEFIEKLGWSLYPNYYDLPKDFYHKEPYPFILWWDESYKAFFVVDKEELTNNSITINGRDPIQTVEEYDKFLIQVLKALKDGETNPTKKPGIGNLLYKLIHLILESNSVIKLKEI